MNGPNTDYRLVQSNTITYDSSINTGGVYSCQTVNLSITNQFTAPVESVVGLYSNAGTQLLHTNTDRSSITTYQFDRNQSSVRNAGNNEDVNYNIAIRVHLGKHYNILVLYMIMYTASYILYTYTHTYVYHIRSCVTMYMFKH